ncbi:MAG: diphthine--ammonia ligase, partial [Nanoarchaeota archaeon]
QGVVSGAIESVYQATRIQRVCHELGLWSFNPLWKREQIQYLHALVDAGFEVIITGVFGYPFDETWLGRKLDSSMITELAAMQTRFGINPSGEGGELETLTLFAPSWRKRITIKKSSTEYANHSGILRITEATLT